MSKLERMKNKIQAIFLVALKEKKRLGVEIETILDLLSYFFLSLLHDNEKGGSFKEDDSERKGQRSQSKTRETGA